jgi:hypothetical protein
MVERAMDESGAERARNQKRGGMVAEIANGCVHFHYFESIPDHFAVAKCYGKCHWFAKASAIPV